MSHGPPAVNFFRLGVFVPWQKFLDEADTGLFTYEKSKGH
jgi:hypothetical protein